MFNYIWSGWWVKWCVFIGGNGLCGDCERVKLWRGVFVWWGFGLCLVNVVWRIGRMVWRVGLFFFCLLSVIVCEYLIMFSLFSEIKLMVG